MALGRVLDIVSYLGKCMDTVMYTSCLYKITLFVSICVCVWMDGTMDGWMDGWMDRWMDVSASNILCAKNITAK